VTDRRSVLALLALGALVAPAVARAQDPTRILRIGRLGVRASAGDPWIVAYEKCLAELGWANGKTVDMVVLHADTKIERLPALAAEMVRRKVDVIIAGGQEPVLRAARDATTSIPIVVVAIDYDPVARGHVASLAKPGGNVTGVVANQIELTVKRLDLLKQAVPKLTRVAMLWDAIGADQVKAAEGAAAALGLRLQAKSERPRR
jgi:putative ABC transport system substrate-binding protein